MSELQKDAGDLNCFLSVVNCLKAVVNVVGAVVNCSRTVENRRSPKVNYPIKKSLQPPKRPKTLIIIAIKLLAYQQNPRQ